MKQFIYDAKLFKNSEPDKTVKSNYFWFPPHYLVLKRHLAGPWQSCLHLETDILFSQHVVIWASFSLPPL